MIGPHQPLFQPVSMGAIELRNRIVMAPMTRARVDNSQHIPGQAQAQYYAQRASAGLIVTEGTWPSRDAIGAINVPGIFTHAQAEGWKTTTDAVHAAGGQIFVQLGHVGSASHPDFHNGALPLAPSAVNPGQKVFTPSGFKDTVTPRAMTIDDIKRTIDDYAAATALARRAGFDGVELHGGNVYLLPEFLSDRFNRREDQYGGSAENRSRFVLEVLSAMIAEWSSERIAIRLSPGFSMGDFRPTAQTLPTYEYLVGRLSELHLAYLHLVHPARQLNDTPVAAFSKDTAGYFRPHYDGVLVANGGFTRESANAAIAEGRADLVSFALPFIANPDLVKRFRQGLPLSIADPATFYRGGAAGYLDYPSAA
jgi:N-ethylmaleimide reductase